jgi:hypothetical protein
MDTCAWSPHWPCIQILMLKRDELLSSSESSLARTKPEAKLRTFCLNYLTPFLVFIAFRPDLLSYLLLFLSFQFYVILLYHLSDPLVFSISLPPSYCSLLRLSLDPEDGGSICFWNVSKLLVHYTMSLLLWGSFRLLSYERTSLSFARITVSSNKSVVSTYSLHFTCY